MASFEPGSRAGVRVRVDHSKNSSPLEILRKPLSAGFALLVAVPMLVTTSDLSESITGELMEQAGYLLLIAAAMGRIWCSLYIAGRKDRVLCRMGPYAACRNPLYFFSFLGVLGIGLALQSWIVTALLAVVFLVGYHHVIASEERRLVKLFPGEYPDYLATTPRFLPLRMPPAAPESYEVNPRVIQRSLREVVGFLAAIVVLETVEHVHHAGQLVLAHLPF